MSLQCLLLPSLPPGLTLKQAGAPAIYSHYLKVMMRVNKFHAASGTNCPEATKKNAAVIRAALGDVAGD